MKKILTGFFMAALLVGFMAGCSSSGGGGSDDADDVAGKVSTSPGAVDLGTAGTFVILAKSGISTTGTTAITGNLGVSPAAASFITGFGLIADSTNVFSSSSLVTGRIYAADYAPPTPTNMTTAVLDMEAAYTASAVPAPGTTELGAGNISGLTIAPGVYKWSTGVQIATDVTLSGGANDVWLFQIAGGDLTVASGAKVVLSGGAVPQNVFWATFGVATLGTGSHLEGVVLSQTSITLATGASVKGRLLAQTAVELDANTVVVP